MRNVRVFFTFAIFFAAFFFPATFGKLMASGDAFVESLPALRGPHHLWENGMLIGYPMYADPNQQLMYPLAWLASAFGAYNAFAVAPYVLAAFGMWGFVREMTRSATAATVSAFVYALGGFMISHAGHLMIVHPAAWVPYAFWSFELLRRAKRKAGVPLGALAIGLCAVSGQPQVLAFTLPVLAIFAAASARNAEGGPAAYLKGCLLATVAGLQIGALQLVPEAVLAHASTRAALDFNSFVYLQIPASQILTRMIYPYASSNGPLDVGAFTEETFSVGTIALLLAAIGAAGFVRDRRICVWIAVAIGAIVLALGDATPLAEFTFQLPLYDLLRIPGRHAFEWTFAIAVLAGYGALALERRSVRWRSLLVAAAATCALAAGAYLQFRNGAAPVAPGTAATLSASALGFPLPSALAGAALICAALAMRGRRFAGAFIIAAVIVDAGAFAYPAYWHSDAVTEAALAPTAFALNVASRTAGDTRIAWTPGNVDSSVFPPNVPLLWNIPTADGYTPLIPRRTYDVLETLAAGGVPIPSSRDTSLDLAGVSLLAAPAGAPPLSMFFSLVHADATSHADFGLPQPASAVSLAVISELGESMDVPQDARVGTFSIVFADGHVEKHDVVAGRDTSEFAYDRPDVLPQMRHRRATVFSDAGPGHSYIARYAIASKAPIVRIAFDWRYPRAAMTIEKISLLSAGGKEQALNTFASLYAFPSHWKSVDAGAGTAAFANEHVMPRSWIAAPLTVTQAQAAGAIHSGTLPDGKRFDPRAHALVERDARGISAPSPGDVVTKTAESTYALQLSASCAKPCFVVTRDAYSGDWRATVDGAATDVYPTDIGLRGVAVPAGKHVIRYSFFPVSLLVGALLAASALIVLAAVFIREVRLERRRAM